jgi:rubrerythrin
MLEQAMLREQLEDLLTQQREAEQIYARMAGYVSDADAREQLAQVRRQKRKHIVLTERLLEILE